MVVTKISWHVENQVVKTKKKNLIVSMKQELEVIVYDHTVFGHKEKRRLMCHHRIIWGLGMQTYIIGLNAINLNYPTR